MKIEFKNWKPILIIAAVVVAIALIGVNFTWGAISISTGKEVILKVTAAVQENAEARRDLIDNWHNEQSIKLEAIFASMRNKFQKTHRDLLISKGILNPFEHNQYKAYCHIVEIGINEMRYIAKQDFKNMETLFTNPENTEFKFAVIADEFEEYIGTHPPDELTGIKEKLIYQFGVIVRREWIDLGVSADENFNWTRKIVADTCLLIEEAYKSAVYIQLNYQRRIKANQDELDIYIESL